jgi:hypothetical protein
VTFGPRYLLFFLFFFFKVWRQNSKNSKTVRGLYVEYRIRIFYIVAKLATLCYSMDRMYAIYYQYVINIFFYYKHIFVIFQIKF